MPEPKRAVSLTLSTELSTLFDLLPSNVERQSLVTSLIKAYELHTKVAHLIPIKPCNRRDLEKFHDPEFVACLLKRRANGPPVSDSDESGLDENPDELSKFGLLYDCPVFPQMLEYVRYLAGLTVSTARHLCQTAGPVTQSVAINWYGGRHHGKKSIAAGFCYANDIVLGIMELRTKFRRVAYIDLDLHHGDGVEAAFQFSDKVLTISVHRLDIGFYPGTGGADVEGKGKGMGYAMNIPTKHGLTDASLSKIIQRQITPKLRDFQPECLVIQCGCDGLSTDEHQEWNLTIQGMGAAVQHLLDLNLPTMLLGGGGYNHVSVARCWTYLTCVALGEEQAEISRTWDIIPEHEYLDKYEDDGYVFWIDEKRNMREENIL
ncbi:hypothetical protein BABINDRAFT_39129 [Babjeviella inositovora NRRL Y-12698]|uniref:Histone deacetylase n=1 Tax=Babjeviella inositovora NRRL Y-12698 TaxID=984486 RepID=A0A1E3QNG2_9ASCO|nr:uncharacterized protein BABINDRAFT_39129 [Babjeviella inositovora NRRL Y-12698]ODQ78632.1 hypothetical protein BABINDRAFT_39129 [Babjeviella inositovora NRRL Y-12698]